VVVVKARQSTLTPYQPQVQRLMKLISSTKLDFQNNAPPMMITENAKAFYKNGNSSTAFSLLDHFLGEYDTRYYMHQGRVTYMLTNGFAWSKKAHPEGFTAFALFPRDSSNPSSSSEFNQQAYRQLASA
jgi:hypothetical protein